MKHNRRGLNGRFIKNGKSITDRLIPLQMKYDLLLMKLQSGTITLKELIDEIQ
jgi:hypothetical protein